MDQIQQTLDALVKNSITEEKLKSVTQSTVESCLAPVTAQLNEHANALKALQTQFEQLRLEQERQRGRIDKVEGEAATQVNQNDVNDGPPVRRRKIGEVERSSGSVAAPGSTPANGVNRKADAHRNDSEIAKCELILSDFGGPLTHDSIVKAYKDWAQIALPADAPVPKIKSRRIDETGKLVFDTPAQAKTVLDAHAASAAAGGGIAFENQRFKVKTSRPYRQRRLNDHMGGIKFKVSSLNAENPLCQVGLEQSNWQWDATFDRGGHVTGGKLYYVLHGRPQLVAKLSLDDNGVGVLTSTDNNHVFSSDVARESFRKLIKDAENDANSRTRG